MKQDDGHPVHRSSDERKMRLVRSALEAGELSGVSRPLDFDEFLELKLAKHVDRW